MFLLPQTEGAGCLYILIFQCFVCSFDILFALVYMTCRPIFISIFIFIVKFHGGFHVEFVILITHTTFCPKFIRHLVVLIMF